MTDIEPTIFQKALWSWRYLTLRNQLLLRYLRSPVIMSFHHDSPTSFYLKFSLMMIDTSYPRIITKRTYLSRLSEKPFRPSYTIHKFPLSILHDLTHESPQIHLSIPTTPSHPIHSVCRSSSSPAFAPVSTNDK